MLQTISITVTGKVQGVFFRQSTREQALRLRISGTVKNCPDGSVLIIATGSAEQLALLSGWCRTGPPRARVTNIITRELPLQKLSGFVIER
jgi:acylphosphatase